MLETFDRIFASGAGFSFVFWAICVLAVVAALAYLEVKSREARRRQDAEEGGARTIGGGSVSVTLTEGSKADALALHESRHSELMRCAPLPPARRSVTVRVADAARWRARSTWHRIFGDEKSIGRRRRQRHLSRETRNVWNDALGAFEYPRTVLHGIICWYCDGRLRRGTHYYVTLEGIACPPCELERRARLKEKNLPDGP